MMVTSLFVSGVLTLNLQLMRLFIWKCVSLSVSVTIPPPNQVSVCMPVCLSVFLSVNRLVNAIIICAALEQTYLDL